ncbi:MAG: type I DNA topoisomerase [Ruminococcaceae bacterium]|nr:type I DNA topoisomerase [Oscillospiraceae bacterium]
MSNLVIVESPTKAGTIKGYLGSSFKVVASKGHIRDLPKSTLGIDIENDFEPKYINIRGKAELINELKKEAKNADKVFLATDPDREGEAISWHLAKVLGLDSNKACRVYFNEITKKAVKEAIQNPSAINPDLVDAQQARRLIDRIVGYKISPLLWKKVKNGLSAGRVQSVATKLVVERENEIRNFVSEESWTIDGVFKGDVGKRFKLRFHGDRNSKIELKTKEDADKILAGLEGAEASVSSLKKGSKKRTPAPPFTTSQLQQEANRKLNFQSKKTMSVAQELYEGINLGKSGGHGLITYMRTDSVRVSDEAAAAAESFIRQTYGDKYYPKTRRIYKTKGNAQDAHEAIRPADVTITPDSAKPYLTNDQYKLYKLIWCRFVASQMETALYDTVTVEVETKSPSAEYIFKGRGETLKFDGFMTLYSVTLDEEDRDGEENVSLPKLEEGEKLAILDIIPKQNFSQPPYRYTEATLIKVLEEKGIGRPSTYTPTITTIISRDYIEREGKFFKPTALGEVITEIMDKYFGTIVDYRFTAGLEEKLDRIAEGKSEYKRVLRDFYGEFAPLLGKAEDEAEKVQVKETVEELDIICEKCGAKMVLKKGRFGRFAACPNYPQCKNTKQLDNSGNVVEKKPDVVVEGMTCPTCGGKVLLKKGRYGEFYACEKYPECKYTKQIAKEVGVNCPKCGGKVVTKRAGKKIFYGCDNYPKCDFSAWYMPTGEKCPHCSEGYMVRKKAEDEPVCSNKSCPSKKK